jgi:hypothetical protein
MLTSSTASNFHDNWAKIVSKGFANYHSLTSTERVWFNIQNLLVSVDNGGLISHYYNSGANYNKETIEDLIFLGFQNAADILLQINQLFPNGEPPMDIQERNNIIAGWNDDVGDFLNVLEEKFVAIKDELIQKFMIYVSYTTGDAK